MNIAERLREKNRYLNWRRLALVGLALCAAVTARCGGNVEEAPPPGSGVVFEQVQTETGEIIELALEPVQDGYRVNTVQQGKFVNRWAVCYAFAKVELAAQGTDRTDQDLVLLTSNCALAAERMGVVAVGNVAIVLPTGLGGS